MNDPHGPSDRVLAQAMRAMAGGGPPPESSTPIAPPSPAPHGLSAVHILLIAAIIGVVIGMGTGLILLVR